MLVKSLLHPSIIQKWRQKNHHIYQNNGWTTHENKEADQWVNAPISLETF